MNKPTQTSDLPTVSTLRRSLWLRDFTGHMCLLALFSCVFVLVGLIGITLSRTTILGLRRQPGTGISWT